MERTTTRPMGTTIRDYHSSLNDGIIALYISAFREPPWGLSFSKEQIVSEIHRFTTSPEKHFRVAMSGEKVIGISAAHTLSLEDFPFLAGIVKGKKTAYGAAMVVDKAHRENGLATSLLRDRMDHYFAKGYCLIIGRTKNPAMERVYLGLGYQDTGIRDPTYQDSSYFLLDLLRQ